MTQITTQAITYAGTAPSFVAAGVGGFDTFETGPRIFAVFKNSSAGTPFLAINVQDYSFPYASKQIDNDVYYTLAANTGQIWVPMHPKFSDRFGFAGVTYSDATGITVACIKALWDV